MNICEIDVIMYVVCCFEDENVIYVVGKVSLIDDIEVINIEFVFVDFGIIEKVFMCYLKVVKLGNDKEVVKFVVVFEKVCV